MFGLMFWVYRSNRVEKLTASLIEVVSKPLANPMSLEWIGVSSMGMRTYLERSMAREMGIAAGFRFPFPREILDTICFADGQIKNTFLEGNLTWSIFTRLPELLTNDAFAPLAQFLNGDDNGAKRIGLARKTAHAFYEYALFRPEMVLDWEKGNQTDWQAVLWRTLIAQYGFEHIGRAAKVFLCKPEERVRRLPFGRLSFFCVPTLPPLYISVLSSLAKHLDVYLFLLSPSVEWWSDMGDMEEGAMHHPLLRSLGRTGSDLQWLLEESSTYLEPVGDLHEEPAKTGTTMLRTLQSDILNLRFLKRSEPRFQMDRSIQIHSCNGPLRELEAVREQLVELFSSMTPSLSPDEVTVLAPNIDIYLPYLDAVFDTGDFPIPFNVAGAGRLAASVFTAFLKLPLLCTGRWTVREVFDFLSAKPIRSRFQLSASDVVELEKWARDAGVRWGIDAENRKEAGRPGFDENTWRFGIERLLLGLSCAPEPGILYAGFSSARSFSNDDRVLLEAFLKFLDALFSTAEAMRLPQTPSKWVDTLHSALTGLFIRDEETEADVTALTRSLKAWLDDCATANVQEEISPSVLRKILEIRVSEIESSKTWRPYGVTFGNISAMRCVPFRVVVLMGLNEGEFPRQFHAPGFDKTLDRPARGDRSVVDEDRFSFLESILSARDTLVITFAGKNQKDGSLQFPASPVGDLLRCMNVSFGVKEDSFIVVHPVSPYNPNYFGCAADPRLFSYDRIALEGARAVSGDAAAETVFFKDRLTEKPSPRVVALSDLIRFFYSPHEKLLKDRLGIFFPRLKTRLSDWEPVLDRRDNSAVVRYLIGASLSGMHLSELEDEVRSLGLLPHGNAGSVRFRSLMNHASRLAECVSRLNMGQRLPDRNIDIELEGDFGRARLTGAVGDLWERGLMAISLSQYELTGLLLSLHISRAAAQIAFGYQADARLPAFDEGSVALWTISPLSEPLSVLSSLLEVYFEGMNRPVPFLLQPSFDFIKHVNAGKPLESALNLSKAKFHSLSPLKHSATMTAFRGADPFLGRHGSYSFESLATLVFSPLSASLGKGSV